MAATRWTVWVEAARPDGTIERHEVGSVRRDLSSPNPADLGLHLAEAKDLLHELQLRLLQDQADQASALDRACAGCGSKRILHDHLRRVAATLFGQVAVRRPRWRLCRCGRSDVNALSRVHALLGASATPELVRVQAELGARSSYREAARVVGLLLPASTAANHTGVRRHLAKTASRLQARDNASPHRMSLARGSPMVVTMDGAHIRAVPGYQARHLEVMVGRVEAEGRPARHFAVAPNVPASRAGTVGNALRAQGWLPGREVVVLSDGDPALVGAVRPASCRNLARRRGSIGKLITEGNRMAHRPTNLSSLATAMVEDATKAFARDDGAPLSEAVLRHYRSATRAAVLAAVRRLARGTTDMPGSGISLEELAAELASAERPTLQAAPFLPE